MTNERNLTRHRLEVRPEDRERLLGQRGAVVWLTGLSGSGKSTIASALEKRLVASGQLAFVLDGDNIRHGLSSDLDFSPEDRQENIRRISEVAALFADAGVLALTSFISPYRADRDAARETIGADRFVEVFLDTPVEICEERDPKGLYKKARAGEIGEFTGVSAPYEAPEKPALSLKTGELDLESCVASIIEYMKSAEILMGDRAVEESV